MIEQGVLNLLLGTPTAAGTRPDGSQRSVYQADFVAAVGESVFPGKAPQGTDYPYATVAKTGASHQKHLQGVSGLAKTKVSVSVYHPIYGTAEQLADYARKVLDGYRGALANSMSCLGIFQDEDSNDWQHPIHADEQGVQAVVLRLTVVSNET